MVDSKPIYVYLIAAFRLDYEVKLNLYENACMHGSGKI